MTTFELTPGDVLFFRDGRPIETGGGHGARWPEPSVIFDALHAALWRAFPAQQPWEHRHDFGRASHRPQKGDTQRFGSLVTAGLFPVMEGHWLFPAPLDFAPNTQKDRPSALKLLPVESASSNLPFSWLKYLPANPGRASKGETPGWWTAEAWRQYLRNATPSPGEFRSNHQLFESEWTTGIGIDPVSQTQDGERIYSAQYLRLRDKVAAGFAASLEMKQGGSALSIKDCIKDLLPDNARIVVGGQQRVCQVSEARLAIKDALPVASAVSGTRVKWALLTPAVFPRIPPDSAKGVLEHPGGWLPNWIDAAEGRVRLTLRGGRVRRVWDAAKGRTVRRADQEETIGARLVAARVPKPVPIVGWTERLHLLADEGAKWRHGENQRGAGPRQAHLAVPAGAVYYFEADSEADAKRLAEALNWHGNSTAPVAIKNRRSTLMGEKGFGLGVCGAWDFFRSGDAQ